MRKGAGHTAVSATYASSVTFKIWQNGTKEKYCNFATFNRLVDTKTRLSKHSQITKHWLENESNEFLVSKNTLADLKGPKVKYNLHYG